MSLVDKAKMALRVTTTAFDSEIEDLITAAQADLGIAGVELSDIDAITTRAIITYVKMHFGEPDEYDRLKASYDEQKGQLRESSAYGMEAL